jgi:sugar phosphate isomerase/epimerase
LKLGLFTALYSELSLSEMLQKVKDMGFEAVELYTGKLPVPVHCDPEILIGSNIKLQEFKDTISKFGLPISQLNCSGNPISPIPNEAAKHKEGFLQTVRLAEKLGIDTIANFSGCPGGGPKDETPNWITCPWPNEFLSMLDYQWNEVLIPFWTWAVKEAANYGVTKIGLEMHPGFCVYNPETLLKLRAAVGDAIGSNFDPSHLIWQGIDIPEAILSLRSAIFHIHAKDTRVFSRNIRRNGNLDTKQYADVEHRAWVFGTVGYGNDERYWKAIIDALSIIGYDGVISIEHEDSSMSKDEGLKKAFDFLSKIIIREKPGEMWWV